jgi:hypothetical protein
MWRHGWLGKGQRSAGSSSSTSTPRVSASASGRWPRNRADDGILVLGAEYLEAIAQVVRK